MGIHVLGFDAENQIERLRQCWLKAQYERHRQGLSSYAWFLRTRPDTIFFKSVMWPPWNAASNFFLLSLDSADAAVYAPFSDARNLPALFNKGARSGVNQVLNIDFTYPRNPCCGLVGEGPCFDYVQHGGMFEAGPSEVLVKNLAAQRERIKAKDPVSFEREVHRPCATITDQLALVPARFARAYFDPASVIKIHGANTSSPKMYIPKAASSQSSTEGEGGGEHSLRLEATWTRARCGGWVQGTAALRAIVVRQFVCSLSCLSQSLPVF